MASISSQYYQVLLSQGVCSAIGVACIFQPGKQHGCQISCHTHTDHSVGLSATSGWFNKKRGAAFGALSTGSSLGGVIFPIMVSRLIREVGYGWAMRISAFLILFLLIVANLTVKSRLPPHPQSPTKEELMRPFKETAMMLLVGGAFFLTFGIFIPINFIIVEAIAQGMSPGLAQYLLAVLNATR
jgi:MFS transporter, MCT family, aspergillic acid transporter